MFKGKGWIFLIAFSSISFSAIVLAVPGVLDTTFGTGGAVTYNGPINGDDWAIKLTLQKDKKMVAVGTCFNGENLDILVLRYNQDGTLDSTFGTGGAATYNSPANRDDEGQGVALQRDGKIVVAAHSFNGAKWNVLVLRYNKNGTLDSTFGTGGVVTYDTAGNLSYEGHSVAIQPDGKIVVAGDIMDISWNRYWDVLLLRYNSNGTLDNTFGAGGVVTYNGPTDGIDWMPENGNSLALQPDGKIIVVGSTFDWTDWNVLVLRYNKDGTLDSTFGTVGAVTYNSPANRDDYGNGVILQPDGKIVAVGTSFNGASWDLLVLRYDPDGALDNTFGTGGVVTYNGPASSDDYGSGVALQKDGRIVVVGGSTVLGNRWDALVLRYNKNGTLDNTFGAGGVVTYNGSADSDNGAEAVSIQKDRKIAVVGYSHNGVNDDSLVFRLQGR